MDYSKYINAKLARYREFGCEKLSNGSELIGRAKFIAPFAYLHSLYAPLNEKDILMMEEKLKFVFPMSIRNFYQSFNGLKLFNTALNFYGLRTSTSRSVDASRQPFDIFTVNVDERIAGAGNNLLFIGGYSWNKSKLYIDINTERVFFCSSESATPLLQWDSFDIMLQSEIDRLIDLHSEEGKNIPFKPTVPIGGEDVLKRMIEKAKASKEPPYWYKDTL